MEHYRKALEAQPSNRYALMGLGDLHHRERSYKEALECWEHLLELDPRLISIITMVGNIHRKLHHFGKAVDYFSAALKIAPGNVYAAYGLADALRGLGKYEQAAPYWDEVIAADPDNLRVLTRAGDCYFRLGDFGKAEDLFRRPWPSATTPPRSWAWRASTGRRGEAEAAISCCERILEHQPGNARAVISLAEALAETGRKREAVRILEAHAGSHPESREIDSALQRISGACSPLRGNGNPN